MGQIESYTNTLLEEGYGGISFSVEIAPLVASQILHSLTFCYSHIPLSLIPLVVTRDGQKPVPGWAQIGPGPGNPICNRSRCNQSVPGQAGPCLAISSCDQRCTRAWAFSGMNPARPSKAVFSKKKKLWPSKPSFGKGGGQTAHWIGPLLIHLGAGNVS